MALPQPRLRADTGTAAEPGRGRLHGIMADHDTSRDVRALVQSTISACNVRSHYSVGRHYGRSPTL